jgi:hypothetical protein
MRPTWPSQRTRWTSSPKPKPPPPGRPAPAAGIAARWTGVLAAGVDVDEMDVVVVLLRRDAAVDEVVAVVDLAAPEGRVDQLLELRAPRLGGVLGEVEQLLLGLRRGPAGRAEVEGVAVGVQGAVAGGGVDAVVVAPGGDDQAEARRDVGVLLQPRIGAVQRTAASDAGRQRDASAQPAPEAERRGAGARLGGVAVELLGVADRVEVVGAAAVTSTSNWLWVQLVTWARLRAA